MKEFVGWLIILLPVICTVYICANDKYWSDDYSELNFMNDKPLPMVIFLWVTFSCFLVLIGTRLVYSL